MKMLRFLLLFTGLFFLLQVSSAQELTIKGKVLDDATKQPIAYASVELWSNDSVLLTGVATDKEGRFSLTGSVEKRPFLKVGFIGYQPFVITPQFAKGGREINMQDIFLTTAAGTMQNVVIQGQRRSASVQIDKQVISAKQFQTAQNGTGLDVLQKLSSVTVTNEGEIALRGSTGFVVFINGKRSNREPAEVLSQLPANSIESIEVITSPSAKYDADGKTGIINIITKKATSEGWSLSMNGMVSAIKPPRYGGDFLLTYGAKKWSGYAGADYRRYDIRGRRIGTVRTLYHDSLTYMPSDGARNFLEYQYSFRAGASYTPNAANVFNLSLYAGKKRSDRTANLHYNEYGEPGPHNLYDNNFRTSPFPFYNHNLFSRVGEFKTIDLDYTHAFANKSRLSLLGLYEHSVLGGPLNNQDYYEGIVSLYQDEVSNERSPLNGVRLQADYSFPITDKINFTTGYQFRHLNENGYFDYARLDTTTNGTYFKDPAFNDTIRLRQQVHAGYVQIDGRIKNLSYGVGLRAEYMDRSLKGQIDPTNYVYNKVNWFPSVQALWSVGKQKKLRFGYSKRIEWANVKMLSPFKNHRHEETIELGDPTLRPEISNVLELSYNRTWKKVDVTATMYRNTVQDKVFRVNDIYTRTIVFRGYTNAGNATSTGLELATGIKLTDWWRVNVSGNVYDYRISGSYKNTPVNQTSTNYNGNASTTVDVSKRLRFQWDFVYTSNTVTSQGHDTKLFLSNAGGRYSIWNKKGYVGLQVNNIFNTNAQTIITQGPDFYSSTEYVKYDQAVQLSIGWQMNNNGKKAKTVKTDYGEKDF